MESPSEKSTLFFSYKIRKFPFSILIILGPDSLCHIFANASELIWSDTLYIERLGNSDMIA